MEELLREKGLKATKGRLEVLKILEKAPGPMCAMDVFKKTPRAVCASLSTVYRILNQLTEAGILQASLEQDESTYYEMKELYRAECLRDDFREHIGNRDDFQELSDTQKEALLRSPNLPQRIANQLEHSCAYDEAYWQAVSDVARTLLKEIRQQSAEHSSC